MGNVLTVGALIKRHNYRLTVDRIEIELCNNKTLVTFLLLTNMRTKDQEWISLATLQDIVDNGIATIEWTKAETLAV